MYTEGPVRTYVAGSALEANRLVKLGTGAVYNTATATDDPIGVTEYKVASSDAVGVRHLSGGHTVEIECSGNISAEADVYAGADGVITALPGTNGTYRRIGKALEAGVDGAVIEVLPYNDGKTTTVSL